MHITSSMLRRMCRLTASICFIRVMRLTLGSITVPMAEMKPDRQRMIFSAFSYSPVCAMSASAPIITLSICR